MDKGFRKSAVTAADLFVLLDREFRRRQPRACGDCYVQLPFRVDAPQPGRANWEVVWPRCAMTCEDVMQEVVRDLQERYDLATSRD
jgi:hypothetical protein